MDKASQNDNAPINLMAESNLSYWLKYLCRFFLVETGANEEGLRLFHSAMVREPEAKSPKARAPSPQTKIQQRAAVIAKETWQVARAEKVSRVYCDLVSATDKDDRQSYSA